MNYVKLNEVDIVESMSDSGYVLGVDETGDIKRVPKNTMGKVKTVNNTEPDENGNITIAAESKVVYVDVFTKTNYDNNETRISTTTLTNEQLDEIYNLMSDGKIVLLRAFHIEDTSTDTYTHPTDYTLLIPSRSRKSHNPVDNPDNFMPYYMQWVGLEFDSSMFNIEAQMFGAYKKRPEDAWEQLAVVRNVVETAF